MRSKSRILSEYSRESRSICRIARWRSPATEKGSRRPVCPGRDNAEGPPPPSLSRPHRNITMSPYLYDATLHTEGQLNCSETP